MPAATRRAPFCTAPSPGGRLFCDTAQSDWNISRHRRPRQPGQGVRAHAPQRRLLVGRRDRGGEARRVEARDEVLGLDHAHRGGRARFLAAQARHVHERERPQRLGAAALLSHRAGADAGGARRAGPPARHRAAQERRRHRRAQRPHGYRRARSTRRTSGACASASDIPGTRIWSRTTCSIARAASSRMRSIPRSSAASSSCRAWPRAGWWTL